MTIFKFLLSNRKSHQNDIEVRLVKAKLTDHVVGGTELDVGGVGLGVLAISHLQHPEEVAARLQLVAKMEQRERAAAAAHRHKAVALVHMATAGWILGRPS